MRLELTTQMWLNGEKVTVNGEATLTPRGRAYSDERGDFGPQMYDVDVTQVSAVNELGYVIDLTGDEERLVTEELENIAVNAKLKD